MRTTKRFTPSVLKRFANQARGKGIKSDYVPWHKVTRGDPASMGRSHILLGDYERQHHLLSDKERTVFFFSRMQQNLLDLREQFPLELEDSEHELRHYKATMNLRPYPGTINIANELGFKHPITTGNGESTHWIMSTDFLLCIRDDFGKHTMLAISVKQKKELQIKRKVQLLKIEQAYWNARGIEWLLITEAEYDPKIATFFKLYSPWLNEKKCSQNLLDKAVQVARSQSNSSLTSLLKELTHIIGDHHQAQVSLWQSVFYGKLPIDLRHSRWPHLPLQHISESDFDLLNPVTSRRSAWN